MGIYDLYTQGKDEETWLKEFLGAQKLDVEGLQTKGIMRQDNEIRIGLADFLADPVKNSLPTHSGKIEISCPQAREYGLPDIPAYVEIADEGISYPLKLITPHYKFRANSCLHAVPWLQRLETHAVWINPQDANTRDIAAGYQVEVYNERGVIRLPAKVTGRIMPGVVCVYQGAWYHPGPDGVDEGG